MISIAKFQISLKALLLITAVLAPMCAWYFHDPVERSVEVWVPCSRPRGHAKQRSIGHAV